MQLYDSLGFQSYLPIAFKFLFLSLFSDLFALHFFMVLVAGHGFRYAYGFLVIKHSVSLGTILAVQAGSKNDAVGKSVRRVTLASRA